jgi:hypothetical protein
MASTTSPPQEFCSRCLCPWQATQYKTCNSCRQRAKSPPRVNRTQALQTQAVIIPSSPPPPSLPVVVSQSGPHPFCSRCQRPWQSTYYRTCDRCRESKRQARFLQIEAVVVSSSPSPAPLPQHGQRVLCSKCARPWQSTLYKTCDRCREMMSRTKRHPQPRTTFQAVLPYMGPATVGLRRMPWWESLK